MNFQEYAPLAVRTANKDLPRELLFANAALGMCGESAELDSDFAVWKATQSERDQLKAIKEMGDVLWYVALAAHLSNVVEHVDFEDTERGNELYLFAAIGAYTDHIKKHICQFHERDDKHITELLNTILIGLRKLAVKLGTTLGEVAEGNIQKLKERYPSGFEAAKSIHRKIGD